LTKFETKSNRVKGICFHPRRTWLLASLHSGLIQLWDYRMGTLLDRFEEHEGPVRGVDFHMTQPLFCSGGDDYKIKVWNYQMRRCIFTLLGHLDYIRTVQFHVTLPWIVSSSDDQTIRVWNWQSRTCTSVLTGHSHYVMCASFHPSDDLIVSASLDQTVRVWDIAGLKGKTAVTDSIQSMLQAQKDSIAPDLFGNSDAVVKYVLEGHDRGVNWASFHPTLPLVVSGADDKQVKMWRMNDTKAWEVDTMRGHVNNVSCVMFHPKQDLIVSNSEDKSIRVWDMNKRIASQTFRREHDRFWVLSIHKDANLVAAGHDSGLVVFKLEKERPAYTVAGKGTLYYVSVTPSKERYLRRFEFATSRDTSLLNIRRTSSASGSSQIHFNPQENHLLVLSTDGDQSQYELYPVPADGASDKKPSDVKRGAGVAAVWVRRDRFAVLEKNKSLVTKSLENETAKKHVLPPCGTCDQMWGAWAGHVLLRCDDKVCLYDMQQMKNVADVAAANTKYAVWSADYKYCALISKHAVIICSKHLEHLCTVHETMSVKSGVWNEDGVFVYSTLNHMKYCLHNGDTGIICTLDSPIYLTASIGESVFFLDREAKNKGMIINSTEFMFKMALLNRQFDQVKRIMNSGRLCGQAIIAYLQKKGHPEVALHFVDDDKTRFNLAIECGNIDIALKAAQSLDDISCWQRLAVEALRMGNLEIVEMAYFKTNNWERLSFLYVITGDLDKLRKMLRHAKEKRGDLMSCFHNAMFLGDVETRVEVLEKAKQPALAYVTAATHGMTEKAEALKADLAEEVAVPRNAQLLFPANPIIRPEAKQADNNWPRLQVSKGFFDSVPGQTETDRFAIQEDEEADDEEGDAWASDDDILGGNDKEDGEEQEGSEEGDGWGGSDGELDDALGDLPTPSHSFGGFVAPTQGTSAARRWSQQGTTIADQVAAGSFELAAQQLQSDLGITNLVPLKSIFMQVAMGSHSMLPSIGPMFGIQFPMQRNYKTVSDGTGMPAVAITIDSLTAQVQQGYGFFTKGKFEECQACFLKVLQSIAFVVCDTRPAVNELKKLLSICREYVLGLVIELKRKGLSDKSKQCELAAYFTHCNLEPQHLCLTLRQAMSMNIKLQNYGLASSFARRLLELNPSAKLAADARKVLAAAEQSNHTNATALDYDERNPFVVCGISFKPLYRGVPAVKCGYCGASYAQQYKGQQCTVCQIGEVGLDVPGLQFKEQAE